MSSSAALRHGPGAAAFLCLHCLCGAAASADEPQVLVTASRVAESIDASFWSSSVLTRADIEWRQAASLDELLSGLAGLNFDNAGGLGKATSAFMRGSNSDHTLLLVDGMRVGSATFGVPPLELIPLEQIERIEIVRGPRSTLYGSDAVGGVIQVFTRHGTQPGLGFSGMVGSGSHATQRASAGMRGANERAWMDLSAETLTTDGINACSPLALALGGGCFANEPDKDGYRSRSASLSLGGRLGKALTLELRSMASDGTTEFDGSFTNRAQFAERVASLHLMAAMSERWQARALFGWNRDVQDNFHDSTAGDSYTTDRNSASVQIDGLLGQRLRTTAGVDYQNDRVDSTVAFARGSRSTAGVFAELHEDWRLWSALAGARLEDNEQFGSRVTGNAGVARRVGANRRLTATWGTAFRAPTFNELYYPGFGNPTLTSEQSRAVELGFDDHAAPVHWSLHVYQTDFDRLIAFDSATFAPQNIARARVRGAELQGEWSARHWRIQGQITRLAAGNLSDGNEGRLLPRRPKLSAALELRRQWSSLAAGTTGRCAGRRFEDLANSLAMGSYCTVDLLAEWRLGRAWQLHGGLINALNRGYETAAFFNQDGRHFNLTLRYHPTGERS